MRDELIQKLADEESLRDEQWITDVVRLMLPNMSPVMTRTEYELGYNILFGKFPDEVRKKWFVSDVMKKFNERLSGDTVYLFERIRNALIDERTAAGLTITLNSLDPEKEEKKKDDRALLMNRKGIEALLNDVTSNNGMPPTKFTEDDFHGNIDDFDKAGMDDLNEQSVADFFDSKWGLKAERTLGNVINSIFRVNQVTRDYDKHINNILIGLKTCSQVYVDEVEGKVKIKALLPYELEVLHSTNGNDEKNAQGFRCTSSTNIRGLLRLFGDSFNFEDNWQSLIANINMRSEVKYSGISEGDVIKYGNENTAIADCIPISRLLDYNINYSQVEFRVISANTKHKGVDQHGNIVSIPLSQSPNRKEGWSTESKFKEDTYVAYYLDVAAGMPKIIKWGKLFMQPTEGVYDEYSGFSFIVNGRKGVPMVEILKPFYRIMQMAFSMFEVLVADVKPDGYIFNYDALAKVAVHLQQAKDTPTDIKGAIGTLLQQFQDSPNMLTVTPTDETDTTIGGDAFGAKKKENGLNKAALDLIKIMDWCEQKAQIFLGTQGLEFAQPEDGFKLSLENRKRSRSATQFIDFILLNHLEDQATTVLSYAQDISKYKNTKPYKYMETQLGVRVMKFLNSLTKSPHRHSVFLDTFNNDIQLLDLRQLAMEDLKNMRITLEQYAFVVSFENIKDAVFYLAQERKNADRLKKKEQQTQFQNEQAAAEAAFQRLVKLETLKGQWKSKAEEYRSQGFIEAANINSKATIVNKQMQEQGQNKRLADSANIEIDKIAKTADAEAQKPLPI